MFEQDSSPFLPAEFILNGIDIEFLEKGRLQLDQIATGCTASLNEVLPLRRDEVAASCGHTFDKFELVYTCRDCAVDETCVLCKDCFVLDDHKTHQYEYYLSPGNGGCCDCGETESWRNSLGCQKHKSTSESAIDDEPLSKPERQVLNNIQRQMSIWTAKYIHWIGTFISGMQQKDSRSNLLLLYNDEFHSFDEVIRCVERTFNHSHQRANNIAHAGFDIVDMFSGSQDQDQDVVVEENNKLEGIRRVGLAYKLHTREAVSEMLQFTLWMSWLTKTAECYPFLRKALILPLFEEASSEKSLSELLTQYDQALWKMVRKDFHRLLSFGLAFHKVKVGMMYIFSKHALELVKELIFDPPREANLTIMNFAVQIFTVPSIAMLACTSGKILDFIHIIHSILSQLMRKLEGKRFHLPEESREELQQVFSIFDYIVGDRSVRESGIIHTPDLLEAIVNALCQTQGGCPILKVSGDHILYEDSDILYEAVFNMHLVRAIETFVDSFLTLEDISRALPILLSALDNALGRLDGSSDGISFQHPVLWFASALLLKYSVLGGTLPVVISARIAHESARLLDLLSQIKSREWIRNGQFLLALVEVSGWSFHYYRLILWHYVATAPEDEITKVLFDSMNISRIESSLSERSDDHSSLPFTDQLLHNNLLPLLCGQSFGLDTTSYCRRYLVHLLAIKTSAFSSLDAPLPIWLKDGNYAPAILSDIATSNLSNDMTASRQYTLKPDILMEYNPFFSELTDHERMNSNEYLQSTFNWHTITFLRDFDIVGNSHLSGFLGSSAFKRLVVLCIRLAEKADKYQIDLFTLLRLYSAAFEKRSLMIDPELQAVLSRIINHTPTKVRTALAELLGPMLPTLNIDLTEAQAKKSEAFLARKKQILDSLKRQQLQFEENNLHSQEELTVDEYSFEEIPMALSGTCVYCKERADRDTEPYCVIGDEIYLRVLPYRTDQDHILQQSTLNSCFHLLHLACYDEVKKLAKFECPLCGFPISLSFLVPTQLPIPPQSLSILSVKSSIGTKTAFKDALGEMPPYRPAKQRKVFKEVPRLRKRVDELTEKGFKTSQGFIGVAIQQYHALLALEGEVEAKNLEKIIKLLLASINDFCNIPERLLFFSRMDDYLNYLVSASDENLLSTEAFCCVLARHFPPGSIDQEGLDQIVLIMAHLVLWDIVVFKELCLSFDPNAKAYEHAKGQALILTTILHFWCGTELVSSANALDLLIGPLDPEWSATDNKDEALLRLSRKYMDRIPTPRHFPSNGFFKGVFEELPLNYDANVINCCLCLNTSCGSAWQYPQHHMGELSQIFDHRMDFCPIFDITKCLIYLKGGFYRTLAIPAPYFDRNGELNSGFRRKGPLFLSNERYNYLKRIYISGGMKAFMRRMMAMHPLNLQFDGPFEDF